MARKNAKRQMPNKREMGALYNILLSFYQYLLFPYIIINIIRTVKRLISYLAFGILAFGFMQTYSRHGELHYSVSTPSFFSVLVTAITMKDAA